MAETKLFEAALGIEALWHVSLLPGQTPTQEARRSGLPKTSMSAPISTSSMAAPMRSTPGKVCSSARVLRSLSSPLRRRASNRAMRASISPM